MSKREKGKGKGERGVGKRERREGTEQYSNTNVVKRNVFGRDEDSRETLQVRRN